MAGTKLTPEKITSPFQLMAAWFAMLILIVSVLLTAAANISKPDWAAGYLVVFASVMIVLVLGCVTLMLTVFRPHLQDGKEYAQWLKDKNTYTSGIVLREQVAPKIRLRTPQIGSPKTTNDEYKNFQISITNVAGATDLIQALNKSHFSAEIYKESFSKNGELNNLKQHESIWVGYRVPAREAIESIKIAVAQWPHLKYLHLSNDGGAPPDEIHYQMYFGGATSTAQEFGLVAWSNKDIETLSSEMTQEEFHRAIRQKYS